MSLTRPGNLLFKELPNLPPAEESAFNGALSSEPILRTQDTAAAYLLDQFTELHSTVPVDRGPLTRALASGQARNLREAFQSISSPAQKNIRRQLGNRGLGELLAISREPNPGMFSESLYAWGQRREGEDRLNAAGLANGLLSGRVAGPGSAYILSEVRSTLRTQAENHLEVFGGGGPTGMRMAFQGSRALRTVSGLDMILGFALGATAFAGTRSLVFGRLLNNPVRNVFTRGLGARFISTSIATLPETLAFWGTAKGLAELRNPGIQRWDLATNWHEVRNFLLTMGVMKLTGAAFARGGQWARRVEQANQATRMSRAAARVSEPLWEVGGMYTGVLAAHGIEQHLLAWAPKQGLNDLMIDSGFFTAEFLVGGALSRRFFPRLYANNDRLNRLAGEHEMQVRLSETRLVQGVENYLTNLIPPGGGLRLAEATAASGGGRSLGQGSQRVLEGRKPFRQHWSDLINAMAGHDGSRGSGRMEGGTELDPALQGLAVADVSPVPQVESTALVPSVRSTRDMDLSPDLTEVELIPEGGPALEALIEGIRGVQREAKVKMYVWRGDEVGTRVAEEVLDSADRGVKWTIEKDRGAAPIEHAELSRRTIFHPEMNVVEGVTSWYLHRTMRDPQERDLSNQEQLRNILQRMEEHPRIDLARDVGFKDHSKFWDFDGEALVTGGRNVGRQDFSIWNDYSVLIRHPELIKRFYARRAGLVPFEPDAPVDFAFNGPPAYELKPVMLQQIAEAKREITIQMAYFGDPDVFRAMVDAPTRIKTGALNVILPETAIIQDNLNKRFMHDLYVKTGGAWNVYLYPHPRMAHGKVVHTDGVRTNVGSVNLNATIVVLGEANTHINSADAQLTHTIRASLAEYMQDSHLVTTPGEFQFSRFKAFLEHTATRYQKKVRPGKI